MAYTVSMPDGSRSTHSSMADAQRAVSNAGFSSYSMGDGSGNITSRGNQIGGSSGSSGSSRGGSNVSGWSAPDTSSWTPPVGINPNSPSYNNMMRPPGNEQVDRNRQASAMYAAQDNARYGTQVPSHLQPYLPGGSAFDPSRGGMFDEQLRPIADAAQRTFAPVAEYAQRGMAPVTNYLDQNIRPQAERFDNFMVSKGLALPRDERPERPGGRPGYYDPTGATPFTPVAAGTMGLSRQGTEQEQEDPFAPIAPATPGNVESTGDGMSIEEIERRNRERSMVPEFRDGGRVGPGGVAFRPDGTIDSPLNTMNTGVPPSLQALLGTGDMPGAGLSQVGSTPMYSYEMGGQVGPGGMPMPMAGQQPGVMEPGMQGTPVPAAEAQRDIQRAVQQNPQMVQQLQAEIMQGLQTGEITEQQLTLATQMATVVADNPEMYPQFVSTMEQQGVFDPGELPPQYDPGLIYALMLVGQSMQGGAQQPGMQEPMMSMEQGGPLPKDSPNPDGSIPINAHEGEYVIPAEVVRAKGTDFFDKMIQSYREKGQEQ